MAPLQVSQQALPCQESRLFMSSWLFSLSLRAPPPRPRPFCDRLPVLTETKALLYFTLWSQLLQSRQTQFLSPERPTPSTGCHEYCYLPYDLLSPEMPPQSVLGGTSELSTGQMQSQAFHKTGVLYTLLRLAGNLKDISIFSYFYTKNLPCLSW